MHVPPLHALENDATGMLVGPVTETVPAVKFGVMRQTFSELVPKFTKYSCVPAGGRAVVPLAPEAPSRSAGRIPPKLLLVWKQTSFAAPPALAVALSRAHMSAPTKREP